MHRKPRTRPAVLPTISPQLLESFVNIPIHSATQAFKKALIEHTLAGKMNHHLRHPDGALDLTR